MSKVLISLLRICTNLGSLAKVILPISILAPESPAWPLSKSEPEIFSIDAADIEYKDETISASCLILAIKNLSYPASKSVDDKSFG